MNKASLALHRRNQRAFTLLEVLVAVAIFAVIGIMAMGGYTQLAQQSDRVESTMQRTRAVQMAMVRLMQDFAELEPRPVRDPIGSNSEPALLADRRAQVLVQLTHAGWSNPAGISRSTLQRVAYRIEDNKLIRSHWTMLDRTLSATPIDATLLDNVRNVGIRFMDNNRTWTDQWPPASSINNVSATPAAPGAVPIPPNGPIAVEVTLDLEDWGTLVRLIEIPG